jgi:hypothetical protein
MFVGYSPAFSFINNFTINFLACALFVYFMVFSLSNL